LHIAYYHYEHLDSRYLTRGVTLLLVIVFLLPTILLTLYYADSVIHGGGASRLSTTTLVTVLFNAYELLGMSGVGPGRLELRDSGIASLGPYWIWLIPAAAVVLATLIGGLQETKRLLGTRRTILVCALGLLPMAIVIFSGFAMHWRVLGRHLIAELPLLNVLFALGLARFLGTGSDRFRPLKPMIAVAFLLVLVYSSCAMRFSDRHRKDDYLAASTIAKQDYAKGKRVWWAADDLGAKYYDLPGEFDFMGELTGISEPYSCIDRAGIQSIYKASAECLEKLAAPDVIILSKPETFDNNGVIAAFLKNRDFIRVQTLPAFTVWRPSDPEKQ